MSSHLIHVWCLLIFQFILAGFLTHRVVEYSFEGELSIPGYFLYWMTFFVTGSFLLMVALPLRLIGIKMFPVFVPKSMIWVDPREPEYDEPIGPVGFFFRAVLIMGAILYGVYAYVPHIVTYWIAIVFAVLLVLFIGSWIIYWISEWLGV